MAKVELDGNFVGHFTCAIFDREDIDEAVNDIVDEVDEGTLELTDTDYQRIAEDTSRSIDPYDLADMVCDAVTDTVNYYMCEAVRRIAAEKGYE